MRVLELGLVSPISWTSNPQINTKIGIPRPFSSPASPCAAADKLGQTNQIAPTRITTEDAVTKRSSLSLRCFIAAWIAPSTSTQASMMAH